MSDSVTLHGYRFSVYTRVARIVLHEKQVGFDTVEIDPFAPDVPVSYLRLQPFGRVPVLVHGEFEIHETAAICRYVDLAFDGPSLVPAGAAAAARMAQAIAIIDNYGYWPMVRQVFSHRVFRPLEGDVPDEAEIAAGLEASRKVLSALDAIAAEGLILDGKSMTLADCHLAPMFYYFQRAPEGAAAMADYPALALWWKHVSETRSFIETVPSLPA
jgi:glutathione S-transferase